MPEIIGNIWNTIILEPVLNSLIALSTMLGNNFGLAIIVLTIVVRVVLFPLTARQRGWNQSARLYLAYADPIPYMDSALSVNNASIGCNT